MWVCTVIALSKSPRDPLLLSRLECSQLWCHFCQKKNDDDKNYEEILHMQRSRTSCKISMAKVFLDIPNLLPKAFKRQVSLAEPIFSIQIKAKAKRHAFSKCSHGGLGFILRAGRGSFLLLFTGCGRHKHPFLTRKGNFPFQIWFNAKSYQEQWLFWKPPCQEI